MYSVFQKKNHLLLMLCAFMAMAYAPDVRASNLTFGGQNAALFNTANPNDTSLLLSEIPKPTAPATQSTETVSQLILQSVESQISSRIYNQIFSVDAGSSSLGDGSSISWNTIGNIVYVTVSQTTGTTTFTVSK